MKPNGTKQCKEFDFYVTSRKHEREDLRREMAQAEDQLWWSCSDWFDLDSCDPIEDDQ